MQRIGIGYDVHAFVSDRPLILGGVQIPYEKGLTGHSDADVLTHAIMDALLGAARLGDIGKLFPDTDPAYQDADSIELLRQVGRLLLREGFSIVDIDSVLMIEEPKISPHRDEMRKRIADALDLPMEAVGVKATTTEQLGFTGRGEGVAAQAVALLDGGASPLVSNG
ncbi:MAG: 2-C-methyl-D-erythritol 2,4-cyclodiphosphate synthase [Coriobacteriaceae bacterium]|nr:2-C-methyl-D-erythritol 2,4-cyclodiphosphate synthase [Coriobacteriaceae bacterium]